MTRPFGNKDNNNNHNGLDLYSAFFFRRKQTNKNTAAPDWSVTPPAGAAVAHLKEGFRSSSAGSLKISPLVNYQDQQQLPPEAGKTARKHPRQQAAGSASHFNDCRD